MCEGLFVCFGFFIIIKSVYDVYAAVSCNNGFIFSRILLSVSLNAALTLGQTECCSTFWWSVRSSVKLLFLTPTGWLSTGTVTPLRLYIIKKSAWSSYVNTQSKLLVIAAQVCSLGTQECRSIRRNPAESLFHFPT